MINGIPRTESGGAFTIWRSIHNRIIWHRIDGPACINHHTSDISYWINDEKYENAKKYQKAANLSDEEITLIILKYGGFKS